MRLSGPENEVLAVANYGFGEHAVDPHGRRLELMEWVELELQNRGWERGDVRVMLQLKHGCRNQIPRNSP